MAHNETLIWKRFQVMCMHACMQALMAPKKNDKELAHSNSVLNKQNIFRHLENTNYTF